MTKVVVGFRCNCKLSIRASWYCSTAGKPDSHERSCRKIYLVWTLGSESSHSDSMAWQQVKSFNINRMGRKKGMCLQNCRLGFGIGSGRYASAMADKNAQAKAGTLHPINTLPKNVAVPVYTKGGSKYGHVIVSDRGTVYSDGKRSSLNAHGAIFGWGELCDGVRVVRAVSTPTTSGGFLPKRGYWRLGDCDARVGRLARFMRSKFPMYTKPQALGNYYGANLQGSIREFQRRTGLQADGNTGPITYAKLKAYGFQG